MASPLRILYLEDDAADAELVQDTLETEGFDCNSTRVETEPAFLAALEEGGFDLILADYTLPSFDGLSALRIVRQRRPDLPFIFVSGTLGEEVAIEALKIGATAYVLKSKPPRGRNASGPKRMHAAAKRSFAISSRKCRQWPLLPGRTGPMNSRAGAGWNMQDRRK
jgi:CheY-like chemotaxis protein